MIKLSSRVTTRSMNLFYAGNVLWMVHAVGMGGALYTGMLLSLGMTSSHIGWITAASLFLLPMQIVGAVLQQRYFHRKKFWWFCNGLYFALFALFILMIGLWEDIPSTWRVGLYVCMFMSYMSCFQLQRPSQLAWQTDIIPERESSIFWNRITAQGMAAGVVGGFILGALADYMGRDSRSTYVVIMAIGLVSGLLCTRLNGIVVDPNPSDHSREKLWPNIKEIFATKSFCHLTSIFTLFSVSSWICGAFIFIHLQKTMGFTMVQMQVLTALSCVVSLAAARLFAVIGKYFGRKPVLFMCVLMKGVEFLFWATMRPGDHWLDHVVRNFSVSIFGDWAALPAGFASVFPAFLLGGFVNVGIMSMQLAFMRTIGSGKNQALAISLFLSISGAIGGLVSGITGEVMQLISTPGWGPDGLRAMAVDWGLSPFNIMAMISSALFFLCAILIHFLKEDGAAPTRRVVRMLFTNNPFRSVYHAQALSRSITEATRTEILNHARGGLVESELVSNLYCYSFQVRNSAMRNLVKQGERMDDSAADELIKVLAMPELGLQVDAVKALGRKRYKPAVKHLAAYLGAEDINLSSAVIYALGEICDPQVLPALRDLLSLSGVRAIECAHAAEAISRMSAHEDARLIFEAFTRNRNSILGTQSLVSLCRCMDNGQVVYTIFEEELRNKGTSMVQLYNSLSKRWQSLDIDAGEGWIDNQQYCTLATAVIIPELEFCMPCTKPFEVSAGDFIRGQFLESGDFKDSNLHSDDYVATNLWLQLKLWAYLEYEPSEMDNYIALTILFLSDRLAKRLDPKHSQTAPQSENALDNKQ